MKRNYEISGRFIKKIKDENGQTKNFNKAKFYFFKAENPNDIDFEIEIDGKRTPRITAVNRKFELYSQDQAMFEVKGQHQYVNINFENGEISPAFKGLVGSLCEDSQGKIFRLELDGKTTYSSWTASPEKITSSSLKLAEVVDEDGKIGVIDEKFNVVIPFDHDKKFYFEKLNYSSPEVIVAKSNKQTDFYAKGEKIFSIPRKINKIGEVDKNLFYIPEGKTKKDFYRIGETKVKKIGSIQDEIITANTIDGKLMVLGKSGVWALGKESEKIFNGKIVDCFKNDGQYFATFEENGKKGLYSLTKREVVLEPNYNEIDKTYSSAKTGKFLTSKMIDNKTLWGVVNEKGKEVVPFEYSKGIYGNVVENVNVNGKKELAVPFTRKNDDKKYLICPKADDIVSEEQQTHQYSSNEDKKHSDYEFAHTNGNLKSEDEKLSIAIGASLLFESPIAGIVAMSMMEDENSL